MIFRVLFFPILTNRMIFFSIQQYFGEKKEINYIDSLDSVQIGLLEEKKKVDH